MLRRGLPGVPSALAVVVLAAGCSSVSPFRAEAPTPPAGNTRCLQATSVGNPIVTELPASEKADLEARLREGTVVVAYSGCGMRILPACRVRGSYSWQRTTTARDSIEIRNEDELWTKLPLGAVSLEGELRRTGGLRMQTTVSGRMQLEGWDPADVTADVECVGATHVVGALTVGAFRLDAGAAVSGRAGTEIPVVGSGGAGSSSAEVVVREAGDPESCGLATDEAPNVECRSPIQAFLEPLPHWASDRGPPGSVKVAFHAAEGNRTWDIVVGDRKLCETPCERWIDPTVPYSFRFDPGSLSQYQYLEVPDLRAYPEGSRLEVRAFQRNMSLFLGGTMMTTFGGLGIITGTVLTALGCGSGGGMCTAGLITLPAGVLLVVPGIWFLVGSGARAEIRTMEAGGGGPDVDGTRSVPTEPPIIQ